nr:alpha/beta fold hydrolase [Streptomyces sp. DSM 41633]
MAFRGHETWVQITTPESARPGALPLFVLHGGPGMAHNYVANIAALADETGRTVIHYDQLGCGNSTHLPDAPAGFWTPQLFVDEFHTVRDALGIDRYHVLGQSWGGMLGAEIAVRVPEGLASLSICNSPASMQLWVEGAAELRAQLPPEVRSAL